MKFVAKARSKARPIDQFCPTLSHSEEGKEWLTQFFDKDKAVATKLLDSLTVITNDELVAGLFTFLKAKMDEYGEVIALFAARENSGDPYFRNKVSRPLSNSSREDVGSEATIAHLCRDLCKKLGPNALNHPSLRTMKEKKCRHIFFIDDFVASGERLRKFFIWFYSNKTVRSWHSFKRIKFHALAYSATSIGIEKSRQLRLEEDILICRKADTASDKWNSLELEGIKELCRDYSTFTSRPFWPLGFESVFSLIVFMHKCPNTSPAILWATNGEKWYGIFSNRPELEVPDLMKYVHDSHALVHSDNILDVGSSQRPVSSLRQSLPESYHGVLRTLRKGCDARVISSLTDIPVYKVSKILTQLERAGWITADRRLTDVGRYVLAQSKPERTRQKPIDGNLDFYYPLSLRSPTSSSS